MKTQTLLLYFISAMQAFAGSTLLIVYNANKTRELLSKKNRVLKNENR